MRARVPSVNEEPAGPGRFGRWLTIGIMTIVLITGFACGAWWLVTYKRTRWKGTALERLARSSVTNEVVRQELDQLKASYTNVSAIVWTHDHVLLMTNGEHIVYEYRHGANDSFPPHLFLGRCSDGRWHSSHHFCKSMQMVKYDLAPGSIAEFAKRYSARNFDGKSNECLRRTE